MFIRAQLLCLGAVGQKTALYKNGSAVDMIHEIDAAIDRLDISLLGRIDYLI